jgi:lysozyme family protein
METIEEFFGDVIDRFEVFRDKRGRLITYQDLAHDAGNRKEIGPDGNPTGRIVGTNWGCTPAAVALYRGVPVETITVEDMKSFTREEAIQVGIALYYRGPGFDRLPWCAETSLWVDIGWGSGSSTAIKAMQEMIGAGKDGRIGPQTIQLYKSWLNSTTREQAINLITNWRVQFYHYIVQKRPANAPFLKVWLPRAEWYRPTNAAWWVKWTDSPETITDAQIANAEKDFADIGVAGKPSDLPEGYTANADGNIVRQDINDSPTVGVANKGIWVSGILTSIFGMGGAGAFFRAFPPEVLIIASVFGGIAAITLLVYFLFIKKRRIQDNQNGIR